MEVESEERLLEVRERLEKAGVEVVGVTDHGFVRSIYFFDPNGLRLEMTCRTRGEDYLEEAERTARGKLDAWTRFKASASA